MTEPTFRCEYVNPKNPQEWLDEETRQEFLEDEDDDPGQSLAIKCGDDVRVYSDGGEPEDNYFARDWSWVKGAIKRAYKQGRADALAEQANEEARQAALR